MTISNSLEEPAPYRGPLPPEGLYSCTLDGVRQDEDEFGKPATLRLQFEIAEPETSAKAKYNGYRIRHAAPARDPQAHKWIRGSSEAYPPPVLLELERVGQRLSIAPEERAGEQTPPQRPKERAPAKPAATPMAKGPGYLLPRASDIEAEKATWLWTDLIPTGELTLVAGREGVGKSTLAYAIAAKITRGRLRGECKGDPREVIVVATEDSWAHTIVPRLIAAGADLDKVRPIRVASKGGDRELTLLDFALLEAAILECNAALVLLDPLMSRFQKADTYKDGDVRSELEPLVGVAHDNGCAVIGLIHVNKGQSADPLNTVMGSRAFTAVARSVLFVMTDPKVEDVKLFGQAKSNLGVKMPGTRQFTIETAHVPGKGGATVTTSKLVWGETDKDRSLFDIQAEAQSGRRGPTVPERAAEWVRGFLREQPDQSAPFKEIEAAAELAGFTRHHLYTALRDGKLAGLVDTERASVKGGPSTWRLIERSIKLDVPVGSELVEVSGGE